MLCSAAPDVTINSKNTQMIFTENSFASGIFSSFSRSCTIGTRENSHRSNAGTAAHKTESTGQFAVPHTRKNSVDSATMITKPMQ